MSHFAKVENGIVTDVIVAEQDHIKNLDGKWVQTSYNTRGNVHFNSDNVPDGGVPLRGNFAFVGGIYDEKNDVFYDPQPYPSWVLNTSKWEWEAPKPFPTSIPEGHFVRWDEPSVAWVTYDPEQQGA